jgi:hypothetical protein
MRYHEIIDEAAASGLPAKLVALGKRLDVRINLEPFTPVPNSLLLTDLFADQPGTGGGTKLMTKLGQLADAKGISIFTMPDTPRNRAFYQRFDFEDSNRFAGYMVRLPALPALPK